MVMMECGDVKTARLGRLQAIIGQLQSLATYCNANANTSAHDRDSAATASLRKVLKGSTSMLMVLMDVCDDFFKVCAASTYLPSFTCMHCIHTQTITHC